MIRMKALRTFMDHRVGEEFDEKSETRARELEQRGLAVPLPKEMKKPAATAAKDNPAKGAGPLPSPGGRAGKKKQ